MHSKFLATWFYKWEDGNQCWDRQKPDRIQSMSQSTPRSYTSGSWETNSWDFTLYVMSTIIWFQQNIALVWKVLLGDFITII